MSAEYQVPWQKIHEYLLEVQAVDTMAEFRRTALTALENVFPGDTIRSWIDIADARVVEAVNLSATAVRQINDYYSSQTLFNWREAALIDGLIDFEAFRGSELVEDYCRPNGIRYAFGSVSQNASTSVAIHYPWAPRSFSHEIRTMGIINQHLNLLYMRLRAAEASGNGVSWLSTRVPGSFAERWCLTKRETEILDLLLHGYSASEVALKLFISRRTMERHVFNMYGKTGAQNRRDLRLMADLFGDRESPRRNRLT